MSDAVEIGLCCAWVGVWLAIWWAATYLRFPMTRRVPGDGWFNALIGALWAVIVVDWWGADGLNALRWLVLCALIERSVVRFTYRYSRGRADRAWTETERARCESDRETDAMIAGFEAERRVVVQFAERIGHAVRAPR